MHQPCFWDWCRIVSELNLIYCLIYLDNMIIFWWMAKEHLHCLCVVFDWFREYNFKIKPSKCSLFKKEINYLVHQISKEGVWPSDLNLCTTPNLHGNSSLPQPHGPLLADHKGICMYCTATEWTPLRRRHQLKIGEGVLPEDALKAFDALTQACMSALIPAFTNYTKDSS